MTITLATLEQATAQEVFDHVAKHLLNQKVRSVEGANCAYRGKNGTMCAVGCLMSDEEYKPEMDRATSDGRGTSWGSLVDRSLVKSSKHNYLLSSLQAAHDSILHDFSGNLRNVAHQFKLNTAVLGPTTSLNNIDGLTS